MDGYVWEVLFICPKTEELEFNNEAALNEATREYVFESKRKKNLVRYKCSGSTKGYYTRAATLKRLHKYE